MAPPIVARASMSFRPRLSATAPQIGEAIIMVTAWAEKTMPAQNASEPRVAMPNSRT